MVRKQFSVCLGVLLVPVLIAVLAAGCGVARPSAVAEPQKASQEGIKVHGRWTIEVRNPDGSLVSRSEFDNALNPTWGSRSLCKILGRQNSVGGWTIVLTSPSGSEVFNDSAGGATFRGYIAESTSTFTFYFRTLTVDVPTSGTNQNKLVLSGTATAQRTGTVVAVRTDMCLESPSSPPSSSYLGSPYVTTDTTLASPVTLSTGQQVAVTVVIGFS